LITSFFGGGPFGTVTVGFVFFFAASSPFLAAAAPSSFAAGVSSPVVAALEAPSLPEEVEGESLPQPAARSAKQAKMIRRPFCIAASYGKGSREN
jgi:hypothetical protein